MRVAAVVHINGQPDRLSQVEQVAFETFEQALRDVVEVSGGVVVIVGLTVQRVEPRQQVFEGFGGKIFAERKNMLFVQPAAVIERAG